MSTLTVATQTQILSALVEGSSIRSTERMVGVHRDTITKVVLRVGRACSRMMADQIRGVRCERLELDELWAFVGKKKANLSASDDVAKVGDFWTWVALDADTKLIPHHHVGKRDYSDSMEFAAELRRRVEGRVQISTDKLAAYRAAIGVHFGGEVDYGRIVKRYAGGPLDSGRYSPPHVVAVDKDVVMGNPDVSKISTSHVERAHLTTRMGMRRMTRLTNGFSKKLENLKAAVALHYAHYNFVRVHSTIKTTPAVAAGVQGRPMSVRDLVTLPY